MEYDEYLDKVDKEEALQEYYEFAYDEGYREGFGKGWREGFDEGQRASIPGWLTKLVIKHRCAHCGKFMFKFKYEVFGVYACSQTCVDEILPF